jgi:hypothetical protein
MASIVDRVRRYLSSPQGQRMVRQGQRQLNDPRNRRRLQQLMARFQQRRR